MRAAVPAREADALAQRLGELGYAIALKAGGGRRSIEIYGSGDCNAKALAAALNVAEIAVETLPEVDWAARLQKDFPPIRVGRFFVHGSHFKGRVPRGAIAIRIDAGAAFGTGGHESTRACLNALTRPGLAGRPGANKRVLDMGCGSGILAIAAAKLGARVLALDNDPQAVSVAQENVALNGVAESVRVARADGWRDVKGLYDVVVENILARPVIRMAPALARHLAPGGTAVLAGFLTRDAARVLAAHRSEGLVEAGRIADGDWTALLVRRRAAPRRFRSPASASARARAPRRGR